MPDLALDDISPNPLLRRATLPWLEELAASLQSHGQLVEACVYEQQGHWRLPDRVGHYVLVHGERRWQACQLAGLPTLRARVVPTPRSEVEERTWLFADVS